MLSIKPSLVEKDNWTVSDPTEHPTDTVSSISWSKTSTIPTFATGSWDSHIRIYEIDTEKKSLTQTACLETDSPCLSVDWHPDGTQVFAGCVSGDIKGFDLANSQGSNIGSHNGPVKDVHWVTDLNVLCSVSFDKTVKLWDLRQADPVHQFELKYKPLYSDVHGSLMVFALSEFRASLINLAEFPTTGRLQQVGWYFESPLGDKDPLSCVKFLPDGERFAFGSVGGRCNIKKFERGADSGFIISEIMTFKSHKTNASHSDNTPNRMFPVNSLLVNSKRPKDFLGTCGGEGRIYYWDFNAKNKSNGYQMNDSVTSAKMSWDGNWLAFATGCDWSRGISEYMTKRSEVFVRPVLDNELVYKR